MHEDVNEGIKTLLEVAFPDVLIICDQYFVRIECDSSAISVLLEVNSEAKS